MSILPKAKYLRSIDIDNLQKDIEGSVVRRSRNRQNDTFHESTKILREDSILLNDLLMGLSLNLLGGKFKEKHIKYNPVLDGQKDWEGGSIDFYEFKKLFDIKDGGAIFFNIARIHNIKVPYKNSKNDTTKKLIAFLQLKPDDDNTYDFDGTSKVKHTPTNLNYWHVELIVKDALGKKIGDKSKLWKENAVKLAFSQIITAPIPMQSAPVLHPIKKTHYVA